jgi:hypothetical protein
MIRINGMIKFTQQLHKKFLAFPELRGAAYHESYVNMRDEIEQYSKRIDKKLSSYSNPTAQLSAPARKAYLWLKFLMAEDNLAHHCQTIIRTVTLFRYHFPGLSKYNIHFYNCKYTYSIQQNNKHLTALMHEGFIYAPDEVLETVVTSLKTKNKGTKNTVLKNFTKSEAFVDCYIKLNPSRLGRKIHKTGKYFDLNQSFERVNLKYFQNQVHKPTLSWSSKRTYRTMGYYDAINDILTVSRTLDQKGISTEVIDFIMYHELLHKYFGAPAVNGRRRAHTEKFRVAEKQFDQYEKVNLELQRISHAERKRLSRR